MLSHLEEKSDMSPVSNKFVAKYMRLCLHISKDNVPCLSRGVGAVIIDIDRNAIISVGYNGPPKGLPNCDSPEYVENYLLPMLTEQEKERAKTIMGDCWSKYQSEFDDSFTNFICDAKACPRKTLGYQSGERLELCTCLSYESRVILGDGSLAKIGDLVKNKYDGLVKCYDIQNNKFTTSKIIGWHKIPNKNNLKKIITKNCRKGKHGYLGAKYTSDHLILTNNGWKEVGNLSTKDKIFTNENKLSYSAQQLIYGSLLGDASISRASGTARFTVSHCAKHKRYIDYKANLLNNIVLNIKKDFRDKITPNGKKYNNHSMYRLYSTCLKQLAIIRQEIYQNNKKTISEKWLSKIDDMGLAFWYMDDGSFIKSGESCYIAIHKFFNESNMIISWLAKKFNIIAKMTTNKRLYFDKENTNKLHSIIAKYIPDIMKYKICDKYKNVKFENNIQMNDSAWEDEILSIDDCNKSLSQNKNHVYCIDVEKHHNFLTLDGVVHNCAHAEQNAIDVAGQNLHGTAIFVSAGVPCFYCCRDIINSGIKYVYCLGNDYPKAEISTWMLKRAGITVFNVNPEWINNEKDDKIIKFRTI